MSEVSHPTIVYGLDRVVDVLETVVGSDVRKLIDTPMAGLARELAQLPPKELVFAEPLCEAVELTRNALRNNDEGVAGAVVGLYRELNPDLETPGGQATLAREIEVFVAEQARAGADLRNFEGAVSALDDRRTEFDQTISDMTLELEQRLGIVLGFDPPAEITLRQEMKGLSAHDAFTHVGRRLAAVANFQHPDNADAPSSLIAGIRRRIQYLQILRAYNPVLWRPLQANAETSGAVGGSFESLSQSLDNAIQAETDKLRQIGLSYSRFKASTGAFSQALGNAAQRLREAVGPEAPEVAVEVEVEVPVPEDPEEGGGAVAETVGEKAAEVVATGSVPEVPPVGDVPPAVAEMPPVPSGHVPASGVEETSGPVASAPAPTAEVRAADAQPDAVQEETAVPGVEPALAAESVRGGVVGLQRSTQELGRTLEEAVLGYESMYPFGLISKIGDTLRAVGGVSGFLAETPTEVSDQAILTLAETLASFRIAALRNFEQVVQSELTRSTSGASMTVDSDVLYALHGRHGVVPRVEGALTETFDNIYAMLDSKDPAVVRMGYLLARGLTGQPVAIDSLATITPGTITPDELSIWRNELIKVETKILTNFLAWRWTLARLYRIAAADSRELPSVPFQDPVHYRGGFYLQEDLLALKQAVARRVEKNRGTVV